MTNETVSSCGTEKGSFHRVLVFLSGFGVLLRRDCGAERTLQTTNKIESKGLWILLDGFERNEIEKSVVG